MNICFWCKCDKVSLFLLKPTCTWVGGEPLPPYFRRVKVQCLTLWYAIWNLYLSPYYSVCLLLFFLLFSTFIFSADFFSSCVWWVLVVFFFFFNLANHKPIIKYSVAAKWKAEVYHHIQHPACAIAAEKLAQRKAGTLHEDISKGVWHREGRERYFSSVRNEVWDGQALPNSGLKCLFLLFLVTTWSCSDAVIAHIGETIVGWC